MRTLIQQHLIRTLPLLVALVAGCSSVLAVKPIN